jgi:serine/threonine protein kinase
VYDYEEDFILIIEMCTGGEVYTKTKRKKIPLKKAAGIIKQILRTLIYMHKLGIVHRDIKPENMLFQNEE